MPPPGPFTSDDVQFTFPQYADGLNNNLIPNGQRITVTPGRYSRLDGLGLGVSGTTSIPVVFEYADGSTTTATLRFSDWGREPSNGDIVAVITTHRHHTSGNHSLVVRILHNWVDIDPARDLVAVRLGTASNGHLFALTLEQPI